MTGQSELKKVSYRLIVTRKRTAEVLLRTDLSSWSLPSVDILRRTRLARELTRSIQETYGFPTICLWVSSVAAKGASADHSAVLETLDRDGDPPPDTAWVGRNMDSVIPVSPAVQVSISNSLRELDGEIESPFAKPGWIQELFDWTEAHIKPHGLRLTGSFEQFNVSSNFTLVRMDTTQGAVWFKATGEPNTHELPVTLTLARLFPVRVPPILAVHSPWNGWLSKEATGTCLDEIREVSGWERAAEDLAALQISSIGRAEAVLDAGAKDLRVARLEREIVPFFSQMNELMSAQRKVAPRPLTETEIERVAERLAESCRILESFKLPPTLGHLDLNPGNILVSRDRSIFLDWAEACISNPLLSFHYLREHLVRCALGSTDNVERVTRAYFRPWTHLYSRNELRQALSVSALVAVFAYGVVSDKWRSPNLLDNPERAGYLRSLCRRMHQEAAKVAQWREPCFP